MPRKWINKGKIQIWLPENGEKRERSEYGCKKIGENEERIKKGSIEIGEKRERFK